MSAPIYVIRPRVSWEVYEIIDGDEGSTPLMICKSEKDAMKQIKKHIEEEADE